MLTCENPSAAGARRLPRVSPVFPIARHRQVTHILAEAIRTGLLPAGSLLPNTASLCRQLGVSPPTVHRALQALVEEGWLTPHDEPWRCYARIPRYRCPA